MIIPTNLQFTTAATLNYSPYVSATSTSGFSITYACLGTTAQTFNYVVIGK
jgi:hypothetical protein